MKIIFFILLLFSGVLHAQTYNVRDFGAVADETTINTAALQKAVDACNTKGAEPCTYLQVLLSPVCCI